ncbi:MAG: transposase [Rhodobacteraceae bacterium]|nr:transposase [Paracoccaceae bacterium]
MLLDTLATHRNKEAAPALRDHGCRVLCLPPCSPGLNPIEQAFSKLKAHLGRICARPFPTVFQAIGEIRDLYEPIERWNDFKAHGYVSN